MKKKHSRRKFIQTSSKILLATTFVSNAYSVSAKSLIKTPSMGRGPFYPDQIPLDHDNDLVKVNDGVAFRDQNEALGQVTHIYGRVLDSASAPIKHARIEIWQCDAKGRYIHSGDPRHSGRDLAFQGFGRTVTDQNGNYRFRTIKPVPYPGRTPHIHFEVVTEDNRKLTTQMFIEGESRNENDFVLNYIKDPKKRQALLVPLQARNDLEIDALGGQFDIVM